MSDSEQDGVSIVSSDSDQLAIQFTSILSTIGSLAEHPMRRSVFSDAMERLTFYEQIWCLEQLMRGAIWGRTPEFDAMLACSDWLIRKRNEDAYVLFENLFSAASDEGRETVLFLLRDPPAHRALGVSAKLPEVRLPMERDVSLGERKSFARGNNRQVLERLLMDPNPMVLAQLLGNPLLTVSDVVSTTARRPTIEGLLDVVIAHPRWFGETEVREAVVRNPYVKTGTALRLLPTLNIRVLRQISNAGDLHPQVHAFAGVLIDLREKRTAPWKV